MYTSEQINQIMDELGISPSDASARRIVEQLANSKPAVSIDQQFITQLRADLKQRSTAATASNAAAETNLPKSTNFLSMFINKTLASALVVAVVVIAGGAWYLQNSNTPLFRSNSSGGVDQLLSGKYDVKSVAQESFGNLDKVAIVTSSDVAKLSNNSTSSGQAAALGSGGGISMRTSTGTDAAMPTEESKLIAPGEPYPGAMYYTFKYDGGDLPRLAEQQPVLKRSKPEQPATLVERIVGMLSFGLVDLHSLKDIKLQNFSFIEDREYGYGVYVDMQYGTVNIYQNYERWPQPDYTCQGMGCVLAQPTKLEDLPSDEEAIASAESFLREYSISKEGYGAPRVLEQWRIAYEQAPADQRANYYIPEQVQVVYPLILEGKEVYDEGGNVYGMNVMVDVRTKRVMNVSELTSKQYEKSEYKGETDTKRILGIAEQGGFRNNLFTDPYSRKVELKLGTPTIQMVKIYYSSDNYKTSNDLYMPALLFPIKNAKENNYWGTTVIVPLVKSILDTEPQYGQPIPVDMPVSSVQGAATPEPAINNLETVKR